MARKHSHVALPMRLPALIALLTPAVAITVSPARAAAEASWVDGPRVGYLNVPAPPPCPGSTQVMSMGVSYLTAEDGSGPEAGRIFDVRVLIDVAPDCAGLNAQLRIALPFDSVFYTQNGERIRCFERVGAGETVELPQSECAPTEPQDLGGRESGFILTRIDPPARMLRPLKAGTRHVIVIPVMILAPEGRADNSFAAEIVVDGPGSYGIGTFPHVWRAIVGFPVKPSPHEIRDPKVQMLTPTSIDLQARFYNGLRAGVASFRVEGEGRMLSSRVLSLETNNIWRDFTGNVQGLNPMTTYRWWAVMQTSSGTVETTPQTFTTPAGPPADPPMPDAGAPPPLPMPPDPSTSNPPGPSPGDSNPSVNPPPPAPEMTPPGPMAGGQQPAPPGGDSPGPRGETGVGQAESAGGCRVVANGQPKKGNPIALLIVLVGLATIAGRRRVFPPRCRGPGRRVRQAA